VPFGPCRWVEEKPQPDLTQDPKPKLRQELKNRFVLLESFCYEVPSSDPDAGTIFVVPGEDAALRTGGTFQNGRKIVVPPHEGGETDLASVPWFMSWLVASYGNHTRAVLLHDALYVDGGVPPVSRTVADRLLLTALREPELKAGRFRHWLMWAAVSVFGSMRHPLARPILFCLNVFAVWGLFITAVAWTWGRSIWPDALWPAATPARVALVIVLVGVFLIVLGTSWRAGVDLRGGWLAPMALIALAILFPLSREWSGDYDFDQSTPFWLLLAALGLVLVGLLWGLGIDRTLSWWLWPTAIIGLPIALIPLGLVFLSVALVWLIDLGASLAAALRARAGRAG
jgi:Protein of unknown function (DUF1353)